MILIARFRAAIIPDRKALGFRAAIIPDRKALAIYWNQAAALRSGLRLPKQATACGGKIISALARGTALRSGMIAARGIGPAIRDDRGTRYGPAIRDDRGTRYLTKITLSHCP